MKKILSYIHSYLKKSFDNIRNEKLKYNLLQSIPFWVGSLITGVLAVLYAKIFRWGESLMRLMVNTYDWLIFFLLPTGFVLSWWLIKKYAPYAKGSGIPQVMAAVELANPKENQKIKKLLSWKILIVKIISSFILIVSGGAIGREGPTIQIAGSVFRKVYEYLPKWFPKISKRNMIMTGAAAGLAAAFNTPLGGIVFAIEELAKTHIKYFKTALFIAVIIAGLTAQTLAGPYLYLGYPKTNDVSIYIIFPVILVSIISGLLSSKLSILMLKINTYRAGFKTNRSHILFLIISGLIIATVAFFIDKEVLGSGKDLMEQELFSADKHGKWYIPILRMLGPALSFTSGGAGGIFAPALSAGASVGSVFSGILNLSDNETNIIILTGMVAFLTGMTRAPFTSAILVLEMTDRHSLIFYLMLAGVISSAFAYMVTRHSLYDNLKKIYLSELKD